MRERVGGGIGKGREGKEREGEGERQETETEKSYKAKKGDLFNMATMGNEKHKVIQPHPPTPSLSSNPDMKFRFKC